MTWKVDTQKGPTGKIRRDILEGMIKYNDTLAQAEAIASKSSITGKFRENYDKIRWKPPRKP